MKASFIFGTRPEAIKLSPVILEFQKDHSVQTHICVTGQHREMLDSVLGVFGIKPDCDLQLMTQNQGMSFFLGRAIESIDGYLAQAAPDLVFVQGDTMTVLGASLAAFLRRIKVVHVEAGLRTGNLQSPFPEEMNRVLTSRVADCHMAPTEAAKSNLLKEGIPERDVYVTGNSGIDALLHVRRMVTQALIKPDVIDKLSIKENQRVVLITSHRRENLGGGLTAICQAIRTLASNFPSTLFVFPVHPNPNVREVVFPLLDHVPNICLTEPLDYFSFVWLMDRSFLILTDSGGIQEEAPSLHRPILVMRDTTERPEGVAAGCAKLVGPNSQAIVEGATILMTDENAYQKMASVENPYGDGRASARILAIAKERFGTQSSGQGAR